MRAPGLLDQRRLDLPTPYRLLPPLAAPLGERHRVIEPLAPILLHLARQALVLGLHGELRPPLPLLEALTLQIRSRHHQRLPSVPLGEHRAVPIPPLCLDPGPLLLGRPRPQVLRGRDLEPPALEAPVIDPLPLLHPLERLVL